MLIGPLAVQDGLGIVLVRFSCRLVVRFRFFLSSWARFGVVVGCSWGRFGVFGGFVFMVSLCSLLFRPRVRRFVLVDLSTHLLINPWPFGTFSPGPADCALRD